MEILGNDDGPRKTCLNINVIDPGGKLTFDLHKLNLLCHT